LSIEFLQPCSPTWATWCKRRSRRLWSRNSCPCSIQRLNNLQDDHHVTV